jgi:hypothetical protein
VFGSRRPDLRLGSVLVEMKEDAELFIPPIYSKRTTNGSAAFLSGNSRIGAPADKPLTWCFLHHPATNPKTTPQPLISTDAAARHKCRCVVEVHYSLDSDHRVGHNVEVADITAYDGNVKYHRQLGK